jgi:hypothetical protein
MEEKKDIPEVEIINQEYDKLEKYSNDFYKQDMREFKIVSLVSVGILILITIISIL